MRRTRFSKVLALTLVFVMVMSSVASAAQVVGTVISNKLTATFNVAAEPLVVPGDAVQASLTGIITSESNATQGVTYWGVMLGFSPQDASQILYQRNVEDVIQLQHSGTNKLYLHKKQAANTNINVYYHLTDGWKSVKAEYNANGDLAKLNGGLVDYGKLIQDSLAAKATVQAYDSISDGGELYWKVTLTNLLPTDANVILWQKINGIAVPVPDSSTKALYLNKQEGILDGTVNVYYQLGKVETWTVLRAGYVDGKVVSINGNDVTDVTQPVDEVANAIAAVNDATTVTTIREAFVQYSTVLGIDTTVMDLFNAMPTDQGRQQAVAAAVTMFKPYTNIADIKTVFVGSVLKEHAKMEFINAVDGASDADAMKAALDGPLKLISTNRVNLILQLRAVNYDAAVIEELENSTYTRVLAQVNVMNEADLTSLAEALYAKRVDEGKFFGTENITIAIDEILNTINPVDYITLESDIVLTEPIAATAGQIKEVKVFATVNNPTLVTKPELKVVVKLNGTVVDNVVVVNGTIKKDIIAGQELTITFTFPSEGSYNVEIYVVEGN